MIKILFITFCFLILTNILYSQEKHKFIIGCNNDLPPYEFMDNDGIPSGFDIDLIKEISKEMGFEIEIISGKWSDIKRDFDDKKIDILSGLIYTEELDKIYDFSVTHSLIYISIVIRKNSVEINDENDLKNKSIVTIKDSFTYEYFNAKKYNITGVAAIEDALKLVTSNNYDCAIGSKYSNLYLIKKYDLNNLKNSGVLFEPRKLCFAVMHNNSQYLTKINEGFIVLKDNGKFQSIYEKWFGVLEPNNLNIKNIIKYIYGIAGLLLIIAILILLWLFSLKRQVKLRTLELEKELIERKKVEQALLESELLFSTIFKKFPNPMSINELNTGNYIDVNEYFEEYTGFKKEEVLGKNTYELGIFGSNESRKEYANKIKEKGEISNYELNLYTKSHKKVTGLTSSVIIKIKGENILFTVFNDITGRKNLEHALLKNEERFRLMFEDSPLGIFQIGFDEKIIYINNSFARIFGYETVQEAISILDKKISSLYVKPGQRNENIKFIENSADGKFSIECEFYKKDKSIITALLFLRKAHKEKDDFYYIEGFIEDITNRKINEEKLIKSLNEKEILLKEIHHRVKNNLQIISSLLNLQQNYLKNKEDIQIFQDSQNRVKSMAIIHEKLYESKDISKVDINDYIRSLVHYLYLTYNTKNKKIDIILDIEDIYFEIERAIPFGIMLNEVISNCFKHGFPEDKYNENTPGKIIITLKKTEQNLNLIVKDNGIGLRQGFEMDNNNTLGLKLVKNLASQLSAVINLKNNEGVEFEMKMQI
jgi:PAS domain S-box-containing protein